MKILVIDDTQTQLDLAKNLLRNHEVVTASGWVEAKKMLTSAGQYGEAKYNNPNAFDVVLTDLMMPGERDGLGNYDYVGKLVPYGFNIAMLALRCGVKKTAVVSNGQSDDGNHHQHPVLWACDDLNAFNFENRIMFFTGYDCPHMSKDREEVSGIESPYFLKDWLDVLNQLLNPKKEAE